MVVVHRTKETAEKARKRLKNGGAGKAVVFRGPNTGSKVGWYVVSRIRGKRN